MRAQFSEFSYGFAFTHELVNHLPGITVAPQFPSLVAEGKAGYDMSVPILGVPMFFQYKLSEFLEGRAAKYWRNHGGSHFRFGATSPRKSPQHNLLKDLADSGKLVLYVAPGFYGLHDFNSAYRQNRISASSVCVPVRKLRRLGIDEYLHVTFTNCSNVIWHLRETGLTDIATEGRISRAHCRWSGIRERIEQGDTEIVNAAYLDELRRLLRSILIENEVIAPQSVDGPDDRLNPTRDDNPSEIAGEIGNLLSTYFGLEMVVPHQAL